MRWPFMVAAIVVTSGGVLFFSPYARPYIDRYLASPVAAASSTPSYYPKSLTWSALTYAAPWEARDSAETFVWDGKLFFIGGLDGNGHIDAKGIEHYWEAPHFNDIWSTTDGTTWIEERSHADFPPRRSMSIVPFRGKLWMFAGFSPGEGLKNDVWTSDDGVRWTRAVPHAAYTPREGQTVVIFHDRLWMMGGVSYEKHRAFNDVWYSDNGLDWKLATSSAPWSPRWDHGSAVYNDKIYLASGMDPTMQTFSDVWSTDDGFSWTLVTPRAPWEGRQGGQLIVYHHLLWMLGRLNDKFDSYGPNDVWYSADGSSWEKTAEDPQWVGREDYNGLVFNNRIIILAGMGVEGDSWKWQHDVWVSSL